MDNTALPVSSEQAPSRSLVSKLSLLLIMVLAIVMVILAVGGFFLGRQQAGQNIQSPPEAVAKPSVLPERSIKFFNLISTHTSFITSSKIQVTFLGVLTSVDRDKAWAIERKGETAIVVHETSEPVEYFVKNGDARQKADAGVLKVGDRVSITVSINGKTGETTVKGITKSTSVSSIPATPQASPSQ